MRKMINEIAITYHVIFMDTCLKNINDHLISWESGTIV